MQYPIEQVAEFCTLCRNAIQYELMNSFVLMLVVILLGSVFSLVSGAAIFLAKKQRRQAILLALPFGAGALLAAAFFDLLPESFELAAPRHVLTWALVGFTAFFVLERTISWFHHHHEHGHERKNAQNNLLMLGDLLHNAIDGIAIGAAFVVNPVTGIITTLAVSAHEVPKELGTFGILLSRGWTDKKVILANAATAFGTLFAASVVYLLGTTIRLPEAELLAMTSGMFVYIAASDIIPDIHEQPRAIGTLQAAVLVGGIVVVGVIIRVLGV
jgi:zinc and cadmium transporter